MATLFGVGCPSGPPALTPQEVETDLRAGGLQGLSMGACGLFGVYFEVGGVKDIMLSSAGSGRTRGTATATVTNRTVLGQSRTCELKVALDYRYDGASWRLEGLERVAGGGR